jgi:hypothetical protein
VDTDGMIIVIRQIVDLKIFRLVSYCDVLPGNASVICGFWIYYSDLSVIHQAELQLIITLSVFHIRPVF